MTIKTHGRMFTDNSVGITQLNVTDGTDSQALVTDGSGALRFATVGAGGSVGSSVYVEDTRTGNGVLTTFSLTTAAPYEESIMVFIDGIAQPTTAYTLPTTTSITFSSAPINGVTIRICHLGIASSIADNGITGAKIAMGADAAGDVLYYNGTDYQRLGIGTASQHLATNSGANAPEWVAPPAAATATVAGLVELATQAEVTTGTDTTRSITPATLKGAGVGKVGQVVYTSYNAYATTSAAFQYSDIVPQNTSGLEIMTQAITPINAASTLYIHWNVMGASGNAQVVSALFNSTVAGSSAIAVNSAYGAVGGIINCGLVHSISAGSTSAQTFRVRASSAGTGTFHFNGDGNPNRKWGAVPHSFIMITEVLP